jgi:hypothetical protein
MRILRSALAGVGLAGMLALPAIAADDLAAAIAEKVTSTYTDRKDSDYEKKKNCVAETIRESARSSLTEFDVQSVPVEKLFSVERILAQRRHEEKYCLQEARCLQSDHDRFDVVGMAFSSCLDEKAKDRLNN